MFSPIFIFFQRVFPIKLRDIRESVDARVDVTIKTALSGAASLAGSTSTQQLCKAL